MLRVLDRFFANGGILAYHGVARPVASPAMHVSPEQLAVQLRFLRERYHVITLWELLGRIEDARSIAGCVAITFDDAYRGVATHALPLLQSLDIPATCFVTTTAARSGDNYQYWWDTLEQLYVSGDDASWRMLGDSVGLPVPRTEMGRDAIRRRVLEEFGGRWPQREGAALGPVGTDLLPLDVDALRALGADGRIDFGCHTTTHPALPMLASAEQEREMLDCDRQLREWLPRVRPIIAYPYGLFDRTTVAAARAAGMRYGVSIEGFAPAPRQNPMTVPRLGVGERLTPRAISLRLSRAVRPLLIARHGRVDAA